MRDSGQRKLTSSFQNHCTSSAEHLSQSEIELPLRNTCYYSPLAEVGVSTQTEMIVQVMELNMKITLEMVLTRFFSEHKEANLFSKIADSQMSHALLGIQLLPRRMENLSADYLYVTDQFYYSAEISKSPHPARPDAVYPPDIAGTNISFIIFGSMEPDAANLCQNAIFIQTDMELADGFNALQKVYADFVEWGRQLDFAIFRNADFQEFIDISEEMIACPILVYDPALKLLAYSRMYPGLDDRIFQTAIANGYLDLETVKYFEKERIFAQMDHTGSAVGEPDNFRMHADFARAINIRNELAVYCILLYTSEYPRSYINELYQIFCNSIEHLLEKQHADFLKNRSVTDYFLMDLLDNPDTPQEQIKERIYYNDLDYEGNYIVICLIPILNKNHRKIILSSFCATT